MSLDGAIKKTQGVVIANESVDDSMTKLQKMMALDKLSGTIVYADILPGVDLEYVVQPYQVKENIIVKEKQNEYAYSFIIKLNNLEAVLNEDGSVSIVDPDTDELVYGIPAPVVYDSNYLYAPEGVAVYSLSQSGNNQYKLSISVDSAWMNADERVYPVTIDPTIYKGGRGLDQMRDAYVSSAKASTNYGGGSTLRAGYDSTYGYTRVYVYLHALPSLPTNAYLVSAHLNLQATSNSIASDTCLGAYTIALSDMWTETGVKWSTHSAQFSELLDYQHISAGTLQSSISWDVTEAARKWYAGTQANQGIAVGLVEESGTSASSILFHSSESSSSTAPYLPFYSFTYKDRKGLEDYYSYFTAGAGLAGSGYTNYATGNLTWAKPLLSTTDSLFPYTPTLVYNLANAGGSYTYSSNQVAYSTGCTPLGWKLNIQETIIKKKYTSSTHETAYYYIWADADGTEHYFHPVDGSTTEYKDEDGLLLTLDTSSSTKLTITDSGHNIRNFAKMTSTPNANVLEAWYLTSIADKNNNVISFTFDSSYRPTTVGLTPNTSTKIDFLTISYTSSGMPYVIWNPTTKEAIIFKYSSTATGSISTTSPKYLRQLIYAHGENATAQNWLDYYNSSTTTNIAVDAICSYTYDSSGRLLTAKDGLSGSEIRYTYTNGKIVTVQEYGNSSAGQQVRIIYGSGYTKVRTSGSDDSYGTSDDIYTVYSFDREGRVTNTYSTDLNCTQIYGGASGEYVSDNENAKNSIKTSVTVGGSFSNYLLNGGFEIGTTSQPLKYWTKTANVTRSDTYATRGSLYGAEFSVHSNTTDSIYQYVKLPAGEYNLSLSINSLACENVTVYLKAESVNNTYNKYSEEIPINEYYASGGDIFGNLRFSAADYNSTGYETFKIIIRVVGGSSVDSAASVIIDNIMLQKGYSATAYNLVEIGNFEEFNVNYNGTPLTQRSSIWEPALEGNVDYIIDSNKAFNAVAKITGGLHTTGVIAQTIYTAPNATTLLSGTYIVSGFAKAVDQIPSDAGTFGLCVVVNYYQGTTGYIAGTPVYLNFNKNTSEWQFVSGTFIIDPAMGFVHSIEVYAEYSDQPRGYACFDNIAVICSTDDSVINNLYYPNGYIAMEQTGTYTQYYKYDENNNVSRIANNRGEYTDYTYNSAGSVLTKTNYTFTWNGRRNYPFNFTNLLEKVDESDPTTKSTYYYNVYGQLVNESLFEATKNSSGQTVTSGNPSFFTQKQYYVTAGSKIFGAKTSETDSLGRQVKYYYDTVKGRLLASVNVGSGDGTCYTYDAIGNLISVMPASYVSGTVYDPTEDAELVEYSYNSRNFLESITTESTTYTFTYDSFGNSTSTSVGSQELASYTYNPKNGKINQIDYGNGFTVRYVYDKLDNLSEVWYNDGVNDYKAYVYTYTDNGQVARLDNLLTERSTVYSYDSTGKLIGYAECDTDSKIISHGVQLSYDDYSQLSHQAHTIDYLYGTAVGNHYYYYHYAYNDDGTISETSIDIDDGTVGERYQGTISYTYDAYNRLTGAVTNISLYNNSGVHFTNTVGYEYTTINNRTSTQIEKYTSQVNSNAQKVYTYTYDDNGNITSISLGGVEQYRYEYDDIGQLIREDNTVSGRTYVYTYDNAGNILKKVAYSITAQGVTPTSPIATYNYTYGNANWGDQLTKYNGYTLTYDEIGNPLTYYNGLSYTFTWKNGRQLASISGATSATYKYNEDGIRISKTAGGAKHTYYLNGTQIVAEEWSNKLLIYLYDTNGSPIGMQYRTTSYAEGVFDTFWFEKNLQGDIIAVYSDAGTLLATYAYDAWGGIASLRYSNGGSSTAAQYNPFRYRGYYRDSETGFYYLNSRYYDPNIGRFINADGYLFGSLLGNNLYAYCENSPVSYFDPYGESATDVLSWWTSIGTVIAAAEPTAIGEVILIGGFVIIGGAVFIENVVLDNPFADSVFDAEEEEAVDGKLSDRPLDDDGNPVVDPKEVPREEDGYVPPKKGPKWDKEKRGWVDKNGNVWKPQPTGSAGAHGGGHWDVQSPGGGYTNVYPGGKIRGGQAPYPKIPIFK